MKEFCNKNKSKKRKKAVYKRGRNSKTEMTFESRK